MSAPRTATVVAARPVGPDARHLELRLAPGTPLAFHGGQYVIVHTGVPLPNGRTAKRAYSILSPDEEPDRLELAVQRIGPGSTFVHGLAPGAEIAFSGPWGSFVPGANPGAGAGTLVLATTTGITAALGLIRGAAFASRVGRTLVVWIPGAAPFVPEAFVRARVPAGAVLRVVHGEAPALAVAALREHGAAEAYLAGDGAQLHPAADALIAAGLPTDRIRLEAFYNNPARRAPA